MPGLINALSLLLGLFFSIKGISSFNLIHTIKNGNYVGNQRAEGAMALKDKGDSIGDDSLNDFKPSMDWIAQCVSGLDPTARGKSNINSASFGCLIDDPEETMAIPLIGLDMEHNVALIRRAALIKPSSRKKPLVAVMRCMGGGKTRTLEEVRRVFLKDPNVLTLPITFNNESPIRDSDEWNEAPAKKEWWYALSVTSRLLAVFYGVSSYNIAGSFEKNMDTLPDNKPELLIAACVQHLVHVVNEQNLATGLSAVSTVVVLVDEVVKLERHLAEYFDNKKGDVTSVLRYSLLTQSGSKLGVDLALVVSTMQVGPTGVTDTSGRGVWSLLVPSTLDISQVVTVAWLGSKNVAWEVGLTSNRLNSVLALVAGTLNSLPRLVQFSRDYFEQANGVIGMDSISPLFAYVREMIKCRYNPQMPSVGLMYKLMYNQTVLYNDEVKAAMELGSLSNSINLKPVRRETDLILRPESCILMLSVAVEEAVRGLSLFTIGSPEMDIAYTLDKSFERIFGQIERWESEKKSRKGKILEVIFYECLLLRSKLAGKLALTNPTPLGTLFGMSPTLLEKSPLESVLSKTLSAAPFGVQEYSMTECSYIKNGNPAVRPQCVKELEDIELTASKPIVLVDPCPNECWDMAVKMLVPDEEHAVYLFFDSKSREENAKESNHSIKEINDLPKYGKQYLRVKKMFKDRPNKYVYIYQSTEPKESQALDGGQVIFHGRTQTELLFGFWWSIYKAARALRG
jgi:hypothetical protein